MEQIVEKITQNLLQKLPEQAQTFTPDELLSAGVPFVVVQTLRKNVESIVDSELAIPDFEYLQLNHEKVQAAWQHFVEISRQHLRIPEEKLPNLLTEAVEQCLALAVKPRQSVPEIIFKTREIIDLKIAKERVASIEVNKQLGIALLRYMEKKQKDEITLEQARLLIKKVDERLVEDYHPLKWAEVLKPLFKLAGPAVDSELFRLFFEDKDKPAYARKFAQLEETLNESDFIEALSSADVLDIEGYQEEQPELFVPMEKESEPEKEVKSDDVQLQPQEEEVPSNDEEEEQEENVVEEQISDQEIEDEKENVDEESPEEDPKEVPVENTEHIHEQDEKPPFDEDETEDEEPEYKALEVSEEELDEDNEPEEEQDNIVDLFSKIREVDYLEQNDEETQPVISLAEDEEDDDDNGDDNNISLLNKFIFDEDDKSSMESEDTEPERAPQNPSSEKEPMSIYQEMNLIKDGEKNKQSEHDFFGKEDAEEDQVEIEKELSFKIETPEEETVDVEGVDPPEKDQQDIETDEDEDDDQPMWRSFLERDDLETDSGYEYDEDDEQVEVGGFKEEENDGFIEEPIYDLTTEDQNQAQKIRKISDWMDDEKDRFVDEIFMGSEFAYEQALNDIMDFENWKAASMYLESEIFSRNKIDVYDEVAVDFTDRLHSYFLENNSNYEE